MKRFIKQTFLTIPFLGCALYAMGDSFFNKSPDVSALINSKVISDELRNLAGHTYALTSVDEVSVPIDDGTRGYKFQMTPIADGYLNCNFVVWVSPFPSDTRIAMHENDCPKAAR